MGPSKEGQLLDGYTIKTHIFIFCKRRIAMKNQKRSGNQNGGVGGGGDFLQSRHKT